MKPASADLITWDDNWLIGHDEIDKDHKILVGIIRRLQKSITASKSAEVLESIVDELILYTQYHFNREERLFQECGYSEAESHKEKHDMLLHYALEFKDTITEDGASEGVSEEVHAFLKHWLVDHILTDDLAFGEFWNVNKQG